MFVTVALAADSEGRLGRVKGSRPLSARIHLDICEPSMAMSSDATPMASSAAHSVRKIVSSRFVPRIGIMTGSREVR